VPVFYQKIYLISLSNLKPLIFLTSTILILLFVLTRQSLPPTTPPTTLPSLTTIPTSTSTPPQEITYNQKIYQYYYRQIKPTDTFKLIPNFTESHQTSSQIIQINDCDFGINGGFYRTDNKPLGYFYANNKQFNVRTASPTFAGLLISKNNQFQIDSISNLPTDPKDFDFIFQTGPYYNLSEPTASFVDQDFDRRHLIATDSQNQFYFFSIFEKDHAFSGPRLQDIPDIFKSKMFRNISQFTTVLNLDGGSASTYLDSSQDIKVEELSPIGSFLCGKTN